MSVWFRLVSQEWLVASRVVAPYTFCISVSSALVNKAFFRESRGFIIRLCVVDSAISSSEHGV